MKSMLKLFCIALISAGFVLSGCEKQEQTAEEGETVEPAEEEEAAAAEEDVAEEPAEEDTGAAQEGDAEGDAEEGDAGEEGAAAEQQEQQQKQAAKAQTPPITGTVTGNVGGSGITNGELKLMISKDYNVKGSFTGKREDVRFVIPLEGSINKQNNAIDVRGSRDGNTARLNGKVNKGAVAGTLSGKINQNDFNSRVTISK